MDERYTKYSENGENTDTELGYNSYKADPEKIYTDSDNTPADSATGTEETDAVTGTAATFTETDTATGTAAAFTEADTAADTAAAFTETETYTGNTLEENIAQSADTAYSAETPIYTETVVYGDNSASYDTYANTDTQDAYSQYIDTPSNDLFSNYTDYSNSTNQQPSGSKPVREKSRAAKFFTVLGCAIVFGLVAAGVFIGTIFVYNKVTGKNEETNVSLTTVRDISEQQATGIEILSDSTERIGTTAILDSVNSTSTDISDIVEKCMPSIVSINTKVTQNSIFGKYQATGAGSGIIMEKNDDELLIATNNHVISDSTETTITFCDETTAIAVTKGADSIADLAVVAVKLSDISEETLKTIKVASLGDSDQVKVGQMAIAIGNSLGYGQSVTVGYISAKDREVNVDNQKMILLQTDAAINPGNSGGALLNLDGEVVGINSVKYADASVEGMGFAIPISRAQNILAELATREVLAVSDQGYLGIICIGITKATADSYNWPMGVYVKELVPDGAAEKAGMQVGDIIVAIDDTETITQQQLLDKLAATRRDTTVTVTLKRLIDGTHEEMKLDVTLGSKPADNADKDKPADTPESKDVPEKFPNSEDGLENTPFVTPDENDSQSGAPDNGNDNNGVPGNETPGNETNPGDTSPYGDDYYDYYGDIFDDFFGYDPFEFFFGN